MAAFPGLSNGLQSVSNLLAKRVNFGVFQAQQVRTKFVDSRQLKDQKRRVCLKNFGHERLMLNSIYRSKVLPPEIRDVAHEDVKQLPRDSNYIRLRNRCYVTSRPRALIQEFRVSRIVFRHLADYNQLASIQRAMW